MRAASLPGMNVDIQTERVAMRPEWHGMIDDWLAACRRRHPDVEDVELSLRHASDAEAAESVSAVAVARGRSLRAGMRAREMAVALHETLDALERELALNEAIRPRPDRLQ
jgi:hypothetical protein